MLLTGTFIRALDEKQRFSLPKPLREATDFPACRVVYLAPGTDGSLNLYPEASFAQLASQLDSASPTGNDVRAFSRLFFAQAQRVEIDKQGRVRIPAELARLVHLEHELVLLGVRDHLEIWNRQQWNDYLSDRIPRYDEIAEGAFSAPGESQNDRPESISQENNLVRPR